MLKVTNKGKNNKNIYVHRVNKNKSYPRFFFAARLKAELAWPSSYFFIKKYISQKVNHQHFPAKIYTS